VPYRESVDVVSGTGELVTVRQYLDPVQAQLACAHIRAQGMEAHVFEAASYNPMLSGAIGGTRVQVREGDLVRADALLTEHPGEGPVDDGEGTGVVRCPRCELAYCSNTLVPRLRGAGAALSLFTAPRHWHCDKCGHAWDDPSEGPAAMTPLRPDDPRPVFRLRRAHAGMGLFLGLIAGLLAAAAAAALPPGLAWVGGLLLFVAPAVGWGVGRSRTYDLCSDPVCRTPLLPGREECPRCNGAIAGVIRLAEEHHAAAADFRRELFALREKDERRLEKRQKKRALR
jgi:hypothetical protein